MKKGIYVCIIGEVIAMFGMIMLGIMKRPIPEIVIGFYGFCMVSAFILLFAQIRGDHKSTGKRGTK